MATSVQLLMESCEGKGNLRWVKSQDEEAKQSCVIVCVSVCVCVCGCALE